MVLVQSTSRLIPLQLHGGFEFLLGLALMIAPFAVGPGLAGTIVSVVVGALVVGHALVAATAEPHGRSTAVRRHHALDGWLVVGLFGAGVVLALAGDAAAAVILLTAALVYLALNAMTRYSLRG